MISFSSFSDELVKIAASEAELRMALDHKRRERYEAMDDPQLNKELWKNRVKRYGVVPTPIGLYGWYRPEARQDVKTIKDIQQRRSAKQ